MMEQRVEEEGGARNKSRGLGHRCCCCLINDVGEELLTEILIRLPVDHVFRSKSVCKGWLSLIQNPLFASCYSKKQQQQQSGRSGSLRCYLNAHPQQRSPVLIRENEKENQGPAFSLDFVPEFAQLHGADSYNDLLQRAAADHKNKERQKLILGSFNGLRQRQQHQGEEWRHPPPSVYTTRDLILGSSNGLLLCAPLLSTPRPRSRWRPEPVFDDFPAIYVVCNPHTKQWLQVPPPPPFPSTRSSFPHAANVGFVSGGFDSGCWFKIVRLTLDLKSPCRRSLELQVFSSRTWEWSDVTVPSLPRPIGPDGSAWTIAAVTLLLKQNGIPRLCWMLEGTQAIIYDPVNNVVDAVIGVIFKKVPEVLTLVLDAICVSNGCLWGGRIHWTGKLEIYRASGTEWEMVKKFDLRQIYEPGPDQFIEFAWKAFLTMDPHDPEQVYLKSYYSVMLLDLRSGAWKVVGELDNPDDGLLKHSTIVCDNPSWPTPLPSPPVFSS